MKPFGLGQLDHLQLDTVLSRLTPGLFVRAALRRLGQLYRVARVTLKATSKPSVSTAMYFWSRCVFCSCSIPSTRPTLPSALQDWAIKDHRTGVGLRAQRIIIEIIQEESAMSS